LSWARYVGDERERITALLRDVFAGADAVFCCGGIGATPDDHTRQCAAAALGAALELHPRAKELILERMRDVAREQRLPYEPDRADNRHRLNMGVFPSGAHIIPNPYNKIPGFSVREVHFVPGFPVMAHPMIEWLLDTRYAALHGAHARAEQLVGGRDRLRVSAVTPEDRGDLDVPGADGQRQRGLAVGASAMGGIEPLSLTSSITGAGEKLRRRSISRTALAVELLKTIVSGRLMKSGSTVSCRVLRDCAARKTSRRYLTG